MADNGYYSASPWFGWASTESTNARQHKQGCTTLFLFSHHAELSAFGPGIMDQPLHLP